MTTRLCLPCSVFTRRISYFHQTIFTCQDIWEIQHEKMVAYTWAFQFWAEKADLPTGCKPCLLAGSVVELWEEIKCYISFSDEDVFKGIALLEEFSVGPSQEATPESAQPTLANPLMKKATGDMTMEAAAEKMHLNKFPGWEKVQHPLHTCSCYWRDL